MTCYVMKDKGASKYSVGGYAALFDADERIYGGTGENLEGLTGYGSTQTYGQKENTYFFITNYQAQRAYAAQPTGLPAGLEQHIHSSPESKGSDITNIIDSSPVVYI